MGFQALLLSAGLMLLALFGSARISVALPQCGSQNVDIPGADKLTFAVIGGRSSTSTVMILMDL